MDVIYYWKNHEADMKAGRIGYLNSTPDKLKEFAEGFPDFLWVFNAPRGRKGEVQLLGRLKWADKGKVKLKPVAGQVVIHYDPHDAQSVIFGESDSDAAVTAAGRWVGDHFPKMWAANFQGAAGQDAIRGAALNELQRLAAKLDAQPFLSPAGAAALSA